ncbi:proepiregulin-like [Mugil cephalus]|uniref:proepiregulin-like n=1 Tax=Mugil cephalus TaxID=48193 RepID=UPI001FB58329|nr:proepiregulin-like [Mugil cephalus]
MGYGSPSAILTLIGLILIWPYVFTRSVSPRPLSSDGPSLPAEKGEELHHVAKRSTQSCDSSFDNFCLNNGKCMLLVDINEHHCKCESGFYGARCANAELVFRPLGEEQIVFVVFCVILLSVGLALALYFFCKWYRKSRFTRKQKRQGYKGVQTP